jgi:hypothetical protein
MKQGYLIGGTGNADDKQGIRPVEFARERRLRVVVKQQR